MNSELAEFAQAAYNPHPDSSVDGYDLISDLSQSEIRVYRKEHEYVISHRGTKDAGDLIPDLALTLGLQDSNTEFNRRRDVTKSIIKQVRAQDPNSTFELTGHSLGGNTVAHAMNDDFIRDNVRKAHTFSAGASPFATQTIKDDSKITNFRVEGDSIAARPITKRDIVRAPKRNRTLNSLGNSAFGTGGRTALALIKTLNSHGIHNHI